MKMIKKGLIAALAMIMLISVCGCGAPGEEDMPFNGDIQFHELQMTIPEDFIRDSTESDDDFWVFEKGGYKQYILLSYKEAGDSSLEGYKASMEEEGLNCEQIEFNGLDCIYSDGFNGNDERCQEYYFIYGDSRYAVAMRNGVGDDFNKLVDSIKLPEAK